MEYFDASEVSQKPVLSHLSTMERLHSFSWIKIIPDKNNVCIKIRRFDAFKEGCSAKVTGHVERKELDSSRRQFTLLPSSLNSCVSS